MRTPLSSFSHLGEMLAQVHVGLQVTDARGRVEHSNAALIRTLGADPERARIESTLRIVAQRLLDEPEPMLGDRVGAVASASTLEVRTLRAKYRVCASRIGPFICTMVSMYPATERAVPALPNAALLQERFRLTPREADVAEQLARGRANAEIATALEISPFTARRHTERVLMKLGARTRSEVSAVVLGLAGQTRKAG